MIERMYFLIPTDEVSQDMIADAYESLYGKTGTMSDLINFRTNMRSVKHKVDGNFLIVKFNGSFIPTSLVGYMPWNGSTLLEEINGGDYIQTAIM